MSSFDTVILGGGVAAGYACRELVASGYAGKVAIISKEPVAPYERPALTKAYLHPPEAKVRARLPGFHTCVGGGGDRQTPEWYAEKGIELLLNEEITAVDAAGKKVSLKSGKAVSYGKLIYALGSNTISLPNLTLSMDALADVFYLREESDCASFVKRMEKGDVKKVVLVGGGFIGLEVAAAVKGWGVDTTVVSMTPALFPIFPPAMAAKMEEEYKSRGIAYITDTVEGIVESGSSKVVKTKGGEYSADLIVVGIGSRPKIMFLDAKQECGAFAVNDQMLTSLPDVYAVGDAASPQIYGKHVRLQSVDWARKSAAFAAKAIAGKPEPFQFLPFNYSRVFEYTDKPLVWNFLGLAEGELGEFECSDKGASGVKWSTGSKVTGVLLMGTPDAVGAEIKAVKDKNILS